MKFKIDGDNAGRYNLFIDGRLELASATREECRRRRKDIIEGKGAYKRQGEAAGVMGAVNTAAEEKADKRQGECEACQL